MIGFSVLHIVKSVSDTSATFLCSMSTVDELIKELKFSGTTSSSQSKHSFDDDSNLDVAATLKIKKESRPTAGLGTGGVSNGGSESSHCKSSHDFDDDDSEDFTVSEGDSTSAKTMFSILFPAPFPILPTGSHSACLQRCKNACFLTNRSFQGAVIPSIEQLVVIGMGQVDKLTPTNEMMKRKGAYHAYLPEVGNGALDNRGDMQEAGGCIHIMCLKCSYAVIRLEGVAWNDKDGENDLYLTLRNYYPDWSRLAAAKPVGIPDEYEMVLVKCHGAAAYCCQCSWVTVFADKVKIQTSMIDMIPYKDSSETNTFVTRLPCKENELRRPPLWMCSGHVAHA